MIKYTYLIPAIVVGIGVAVIMARKLKDRCAP